MTGFEIVYLSCFFLGVGFAVVSGLMSGVFSGGAEAHVDAGGAHEGIHPTSGDAVHFPLLSPITLATFITTFGGSGIVYMKVLNLPPVAHMPASAATSAVLALSVAWLLFKLFKATGASSEAKIDELVGLEAEVITSIPAEGVGEIAYIAREARYNAPARSVDGKPVPARGIVKITKILGGTFVVEKVR